MGPEKMDLTDQERERLILEHELKIIEGVLESKAKYRKIVQASIARWVKDFQEGRIKIETVDDLRKLIDMDIALQKDDV